MLRNVKDFRGYTIRATDGVIGKVDDVYFDDDDWGVRYLVVDTGNWLAGRRVLISPISIGHPDWLEQVLPLTLTKAQIKKSPDIDTQRPVSRQHEAEYLGYYGYPYYWGGAGLWGIGAYPGDVGLQGRIVQDLKSHATPTSRPADDCHLRSSNVVIGYHIHAADGDIGHAQDLLVDDHTWAIRYLVVNTSNWWVGHEVLVSPLWITSVDWADEKIAIDLTRQGIKDAPAYNGLAQLDRQQEQAMFEHHGRPGYWSGQTAHDATKQLSKQLSKVGLL